MIRKIFFIITILLTLGMTGHSQNLSVYESFIRKYFPDYIKHFPNLNFANFEPNAINQQIFDTGNVGNHHYDAQGWKKYIKLYEPFFQYNPSKTYFIEFISGTVALEYKNGKYYGYGDVDQTLNLGIPLQQETYNLSTIGPGGGYCEAKWVNNDIVIVLGYFDGDDLKFAPFILIYDFKKKVKSAYSNNINTSVEPYKIKEFDKIIFD